MTKAAIAPLDKPELPLFLPGLPLPLPPPLPPPPSTPLVLPLQESPVVSFVQPLEGVTVELDAVTISLHLLLEHWIRSRGVQPAGT